MGIVSSIKARARPIFAAPVWTPERLQGLVKTEEYLTFREARASAITWLIVPSTIYAAVVHGGYLVPALALGAVILMEPHLATLRSPLRSTLGNMRSALSLPWLFWWSKPLSAIGLYWVWSSLVRLRNLGNNGDTFRFDPHFQSILVAVGFVALALWIRHRLLHGQKMQMFLKMYRDLGVSRQAPEPGLFAGLAARLKR